MLKVFKSARGATLVLFACGSLTAAPVQLLDGWQFAPGNHPPGSSAANWQSVSLPQRFSARIEFKNYRGWLTLRRELPRETNQWKLQNIPLALRTSQISDVAELYINDHIIARKGNADPYRPGLYQFFLVDIPGSALNENGINFITLKLFSDGEKPLHVVNRVFELGPAREIYSNYFYNEVLQFALLSVYLIVGLYHLLLALNRKKDIYNFFFGLFSMLVSFYWFLYTGTRDLIFGEHQLLRTRIEYVVVFFIPPALLLFLSYLFERPESRFNRIFHRGILVYASLILILVLTTAIADYPVMQIALKSWQLTLPFVLIASITLVIIESFRRNKDARYLIGGLAILLSGALFDLLIALNVIQAARISQYSFLAFVLAIAAILSNRFVRVHNQAEELNTNLEQKVRDRTRELEQTLSEVRNLKEQQDGDYFLTSLLIAPLSENNNQSRTVLIDTFIRQKKQFHFRKWFRDIGGDMNIAHTIQLRDREYSIFVNADAMGKSLQGAGGALVLGAVFLSIIERSRLNPNEQNKSTEQWIRDAFIEMQKVFESFDGSMLISMIFGMIDSHSGLMYLMNAEHPLPVLYRDGKASFLEGDVIFRKLGSSLVHGRIQIQTRQLHSGDIIILGSDGRDDIIISENPEGEKVINEDEKQFLLRVEEGNGILENIAAAIEKSGELYDDLSLMRIQFDPEYMLLIEDNPPKTAEVELLTRLRAQTSSLDDTDLLQILEKYLTEEKIHSRIAKEAVKLYTRLRDYEKAAEAVEKYLEIKPDESEYFLAASYIYRKQDNLEKAIDYGERLRLRNPFHRRNLLQLADTWLEAGNTTRSRQLLQELLAGNSTDDQIFTKANQLLQRIEFTGQ